MCKKNNMGPLVEDTAEDLKGIQQSLWELQKLLTDLPDDMLEDSRDSSPELEYSVCSTKNTGNSPQSTWTQQWSVHPRPASHEQAEYAYEGGDVQRNGHLGHTQSRPHAWSRPSQDHQSSQGDYTYTSMGSEKDADFSTHTNDGDVYYERDVKYERTDDQNFGDHGNARNHFQNLGTAAADRVVDQYKANYNPQHPPHQPKMFNSQQAAQQHGHLGHLQREFLDSTQQTADREQLAQLQILNKAQQRQMEDLEQKLEDSRRNMRYVEHQFAIAKDEKDGLAVSLKESSQLLEEAKEREVQMQNKLRALEQQIQVLSKRDQENTNKQRVAEAAVDSMKQQMLELCRSDTLSRTRQQHDRDLAVLKEQHESALLTLQQKLDSTCQALDDQTDVAQRLKEQVKQLERKREEDQLERARVVNTLTQRLEESQQQCAKLLETSSVQELTQIQIKLQQAQSARALSENMNKVLQEDLSDLKEQITLYESAVKHGVIALDLSSEWENQLSESCVDLGLKKTNRKNGLHSPALAHLSDSKLPKDEALRLLRVEMQRCLASLKGKRHKISQLQEELQHSQEQVTELQTQLDEAKLSSSIRENVQIKHLDLSGESQKEFTKLQEDKRRLQEQVEVLEKKNKELKQCEEKLRSTNTELCTKMREMIQELDQEKQEAAERSERIHQQYRDDVVNRIRTELMLEHDTQVEQLTVQHQQQVQQFQTQLSEVNDKMLAVQECYISVCKEKDVLEENMRNMQEKEEALKIDKKQKLREETDSAVKKLRVELEAQHQASVNQLKAQWSKEKEADIKLQVNSQVDLAKAAFKEELQKAEESWAQRLEEARRERDRETAEAPCQTDQKEASSVTITVSEMDLRLSAQKQQLQMEADKVKHKAVEEARKQVQRELHERHLQDMAKQVEGAVTRAYNRWIEDLTSLPEYQAALQTEREKWEEFQEKHTNQQVSLALKDAQEQWHRKHRLEEQIPGTQRMEQLQEEVAALQSQLEQVRREQTALLKAELAGARAVWNRDKQQEISVVQARTEQVFQNKLQEQHKQQQQAIQQAREEAGLQKKELLLQMEARLQQTLRAREEEWRCQHAERERTQKDKMREEFIAELQTCLKNFEDKLHMDLRTDQQVTEDTRRKTRASAEDTITQIIQNFCKDTVHRAVSQAKKEWKKVNEERLSQVIKETQQQHEREINKMQSCLSQMKEQGRCRKECAEALSKLQRKNQELQKNLEKACRQLQHSVREHKTALQHLREEHESSIQKTKEEHRQQLEEVKRGKEPPGGSDQQHDLQQGLEEMKQHYLTTVEKIRGDMLRYLQESRERATEMIHAEVQRERQDTARKMRRYYLTCLQELLEDGGKTTGAEKKIMNAASKLAAMAKVLETPIKSKSGKNNLQSCLTAADCPPDRHVGFSKTSMTLPELPHISTESIFMREKTFADPEQKQAVRNQPLCHKDVSASKKENSSGGAGLKLKASAHSHLQPFKASPQMSSPSQVDFGDASVRSKSRELYLQGCNSKDSELQRQPFIIQEAPVREERPADWSVTSSDSEIGFQAARLSHSGRKVEPVRPFSLSVASAGDLREFGDLTPDVSDLTVYNEIPKRTPHIQNFPNTKLSSHREPTPGSEGEKQQGACSRLQFAELRQRHQQDSGFDSPFYQHK